MHLVEEVQSCITSITFPDNIRDYEEGLLNSEEDNGKKLNDIETIVQFNCEMDLAWTAPKWLASGDIMFFYLTKSFKTNTSKLLRKARRDLVPFIKKADYYANLYSGSIFACAEIQAPSFYETKGIFPHFDSKVFAPIKSVYLFKLPVFREDFKDFIKIGQGSITPLFGNSFEKLVNIIGTKNPLPPILKNKKSEKGFYGINKNNWTYISCKNSKRFLNERQLRDFFIDYLVEYIKDDGSKVLEECDCFRDASLTGIVDYFIYFGGHWLPIEAKLNIMAERDLYSQIQKYINIDYFDNKGRQFHLSKNEICLVIDQSGLYITCNSEFINCDGNNPYLKRADINEITLKNFRITLLSIIRELKKGSLHFSDSTLNNSTQIQSNLFRYMD